MDKEHKGTCIEFFSLKAKYMYKREFQTEAIHVTIYKLQQTAMAAVGNVQFSCVEAQRAFGAKMTSYQRRCDVITSHRR